MNEAGDSQVSLVAVVQAGRTYRVEVELWGELKSVNTSAIPIGLQSHIRAHPLIVFGADDERGLFINGDLHVTVGTSVAAELQALWSEIDRLRRDLRDHTHEYLTGKGVGHNNTAVTTGPAIVR
jgi:hypothetical protein